MIKMADAVYDAGDHEKAIALYKSMTFVFPNRFEPWLKWGNVEYQHYDPKAALEIFQECQSIFTHPLIDLCIARCFIEMSDFNNAKISLEKTIAGAEAANVQEIKEQAVSALDQIKSF
jgi:tetratricopeptide (TPR) repeat protein